MFKDAIRQIMEGAVLHSIGPNGTLSESYYIARFKTLREPLGFPISAAKLPDDKQAIHAWVEENNKPVSVGRIHLIPEDSSGSCSDTSDANSTSCPDFLPLNQEGCIDSLGNILPNFNSIRPAVQIRQMGTIIGYQRKGYASLVLNELEISAVKLWGSCTGLLQARRAAIPFYESQGWVSFGEEYMIDGIGPHISMWKPLTNNSQKGGE